MGSQPQAGLLRPGTCGKSCCFCGSLSFAGLFGLSKLGWFHFISPCLPVHVTNSPDAFCCVGPEK